MKLNLKVRLPQPVETQVPPPCLHPWPAHNAFALGDRNMNKIPNWIYRQLRRLTGKRACYMVGVADIPAVPTTATDLTPPYAHIYYSPPENQGGEK